MAARFDASAGNTYELPDDERARPDARAKAAALQDPLSNDSIRQAMLQPPRYSIVEHEAAAAKINAKHEAAAAALIVKAMRKYHRAHRGGTAGFANAAAHANAAADAKASSSTKEASSTADAGAAPIEA